MSMLYILLPLFLCNFLLLFIVFVFAHSISISSIFILYLIRNQSSLMATRFQKNVLNNTEHLLYRRQYTSYCRPVPICPVFGRL